MHTTNRMSFTKLNELETVETLFLILYNTWEHLTTLCEHQQAGAFVGSKKASYTNRIEPKQIPITVKT